MDSGVSWRRAMLIARLRYPNAELSTVLYFAKEIYMTMYNANANEQRLKAKRRVKKPKERYVLQGASI